MESLDSQLRTMPTHPPIPGTSRLRGTLRAGGASSAAIRGSVADVRPRGLASNASSYAEVLPRLAFLAQLQRERRRSDRSKAPLSLVILRPVRSGAAIDGPDGVLAELAASVRETDIIGHLERGEVGVLLTETDDAGLRTLVRKILDKIGPDRVAVESATYPSDLFERLAVDGAPPPGASPVFMDHDPGAVGQYRMKRVLDVLGTVGILVLLWPLMVAAAIAVKLSSPGPIIFKQTRVGRGGVPFSFYKFRSMVCNNDDRVHREYVASFINGDPASANQGADGKPLYKIKNDPRVTAVGRFIRKTSIDELPQLFNVLKGDLSLVGPRPPLPYEAGKYQSWHLRRVLEVKPGITGLWQVEGRSKTTFDEMVRLDLRYVRNCSFALDMRILLKTVAVVLRDDGAR